MGAKVVGLDYTYLYKQETAFGTALTSGMTVIPTEELVINHDVKSHLLNRATGLRGPIDDDHWTDQVGSTPTAQCSYYVSRGMLPLLTSVLQRTPAYAAVGNVTTFYTEVYSGMPNFANNEGYFYTLLANSPVASQDERLTSAIGQSFTLSIAPDDNEGALFAQHNFVSKSSATGQSVTPTGTTTWPVMTQLYKWSDIQKVTVAGTDMVNDFISFEVTVNNNAKAVPDGPARDFVLPKWDVTGSITFMAGNTDVRTLMSNILSTAPDAGKALKIYFGTTSDTPAAADDLVLTVFLNFTEYSFDKSEDERVTLSFQGLFDSAGTNKPFTLAYYSA